MWITKPISAHMEMNARGRMDPGRMMSTLPSRDKYFGY